MDSDIAKLCAKGGPDLLSRVVRDVAKIERAHSAAFGWINERLVAEIAEAMENACESVFSVNYHQGKVSLYCPDWQSGFRGDMWLQFGETIGPAEDHTWVAAATASRSARMFFELTVRRGLTPLDAILAEIPALAARLIDFGFQLADRGKRLLIPIVTDAERLAEALVSGDFEDALAPVRDAVGIAVAAKAEIDLLVALARQPASSN